MGKDEDLDQGYFPDGTEHQNVFFRLGEMHFVWDKAKSDKCLEDRGFDFKTAAYVFEDEACILEPDPAHSIEEERNIALGKPTVPPTNNPEAYIGEVNHVLYVVYTDRVINKIDYQRILSARFATRKEIKLYEDSKASLYGV